MIDIRETPARPSNHFPAWLKKPLATGGKYDSVGAVLSAASLHTVCSEAKCPNRGECFSRGTATFLVMGGVCTRSCGFCGVARGVPRPLDKDEPRRVADAVAAMGLSHAVVTSVTRDDLPDGGAAHFAEIIRLLRARLPLLTIEVLVPDFQGNAAALDAVLAAKPHVFNHNIETVPRLYPSIRPQASYRQSLEILAKAAKVGLELSVKSGLMVGLGETQQEVFETLADMRANGCGLVTIGQYLRPSKDRTPIIEFVNPDRFALYRERALALGFTDAMCGPFVRSSYRAESMKKQ